MDRNTRNGRLDQRLTAYLERAAPASTITGKGGFSWDARPPVDRSSDGSICQSGRDSRSVRNEGRVVTIGADDAKSPFGVLIPFRPWIGRHRSSDAPIRNLL